MLTKHDGHGARVTEPKVLLVELVQMMASGSGVHTWDRALQILEGEWASYGEQDTP